MNSPIRIYTDWWVFGLGDFAFGVKLYDFFKIMYPELYGCSADDVRPIFEQYIRDEIDDLVFMHWIDNTLIIGTVDESYFAIAKLENNILYQCSQGIYIRVR
jgi:hypothetical protein